MDRSRIYLVLFVSCLLALLTFGLRLSMSLYVEPIKDALAGDYRVFAIATALQNLLFGLPLLAAVADSIGPRKVLAAGLLMVCLGFVLPSFLLNPLQVYLSYGFLMGTGFAGCSIVVLMALANHCFPEKNRPLAHGMITASGSLGMFLFVFYGGGLFENYGWSDMSRVYALLAFLMIFALFLIPARTTAGTGAAAPVTKALRQGFGDRNFLLVFSGFFVCGFHVAFIGLYLVPYMIDFGFNATRAAQVFSLIGLFNIFGSLLSGMLGLKFSHRSILVTIYGLRALVILVFLVIPLNIYTAAIFASLIGLLWLSTVPPTGGLVAKISGIRNFGLLYGSVFFSHQIGAAIGAALGGVARFYTGSYLSVWIAAIALSLIACALHFAISPGVERGPREAAASAA